MSQSEMTRLSLDGMDYFYCPPLNTPLYWRDEQSGELPAAVNAYLNGILGEGPGPTPKQLKLLCSFIVYYVHAPCWAVNLAECDEMLDELKQLQERSKELASVESLRRWTSEAMEIGLDPW